MRHVATDPSLRPPDDCLLGLAQRKGYDLRAGRELSQACDGVSPLREGLAEVLAKESSFLIVGIAGGLEEALEAAATESAQIILVDAALPEPGVKDGRALGLGAAWSGEPNSAPSPDRVGYSYPEQCLSANRPFDDFRQKATHMR